MYFRLHYGRDNFSQINLIIINVLQIAITDGTIFTDKPYYNKCISDCITDATICIAKPYYIACISDCITDGTIWVMNPNTTIFMSVSAANNETTCNVSLSADYTNITIAECRKV